MTQSNIHQRCQKDTQKRSSLPFPIKFVARFSIRNSLRAQNIFICSRSKLILAGNKKLSQKERERKRTKNHKKVLRNKLGRERDNSSSRPNWSSFDTAQGRERMIPPPPLKHLEN